ncbi:MAG: hypothetical protein QM500_14435 [Methylococcales bacterium]
MTGLKELEDIRIELSYVNDHIHNIVSRIKSFDNTCYESGCDTNIIFGLLGHKEHVDEKLNDLKIAINKLENKEK